MQTHKDKIDPYLQWDRQGRMVKEGAAPIVFHKRFRDIKRGERGNVVIVCHYVYPRKLKSGNNSQDEAGMRCSRTTC
jgi:hypothetical protein